MICRYRKSGLLGSLRKIVLVSENEDTETVYSNIYLGIIDLCLKETRFEIFGYGLARFRVLLGRIGTSARTKRDRKAASEVYEENVPGPQM